MSQVLTPSLQCLGSTKLRKLRELPVSGEILVKAGEQVSANQIVAQAALSGELHIMRVPEKMGIEPFEVMKGLRVKEGDLVKGGTLLCEHRGLFGLFTSRFLSPMDGRVELVSPNTGHLGIRGEARRVEVSAYIAGRVFEIVPHKSVTIETQAAFIQGIFGVGGERLGTIECLDIAPDEEVKAGHIPDDVAGKILIGGTSPSIEALRRSADSGAVGFVSGAIDDRALAQYLGYDLGIALTGDEAVPMTIIVTEGFGNIAMAERVLSLLRRSQGKQASINGATQVRAGALRPEIIVSHTELSEVSSKDTVGLAVGKMVRVVRVPYFGQLGTVVDMPSKPQRLQTGAYARVLVVELEDGRRATVARANVEIV